MIKLVSRIGFSEIRPKKKLLQEEEKKKTIYALKINAHFVYNFM